MAHLSEHNLRLGEQTIQFSSLDELTGEVQNLPGVYLFYLPPGRADSDAKHSQQAFEAIHDYCTRLHADSVVCVLTTPPDAARLIPFLEVGKALELKLWIAVKTSPNTFPEQTDQLPQRHLALLVLTRYRGALRHTKTRIQYTYCPACGKSTKDYGGKKHTYHAYGTLMSDVWRDIECNPFEDISPVIDRLRDLFGLEPYQTLYVLDLRICSTLLPQPGIQEHHAITSASQQVSSPNIPRFQLLNADCLEVLRQLPDDSIDFCFADPPYNLKKSYSHWDDALESIDYFDWCDRWLSELARVLKPGRTLAVLNIPLWSVRHYQHLSSILDFQQWIAWDAISLPVRMIMPAHYTILCFSKGQPRPLPGLQIEDSLASDCQYLSVLKEGYCLRNGCVAKRRGMRAADQEQVTDVWHDIHRLKHNSQRVDHPCQLPPMLMRRLFGLFTHPDEMILDPFNGAGTSTLVAHQMERRFIGIELSPEYHETALRRHQQIQKGEDPFGKRASVPNAKNSRVERLPKQRYVVSKKILQLDVKRIAQQLGHLPTRSEVQTFSAYPIEYYDNYFISWGEVCAAARTTGMSELPQNNTDKTDEAIQLSLGI